MPAHKIEEMKLSATLLTLHLVASVVPLIAMDLPEPEETPGSPVEARTIGLEAFKSIMLTEAIEDHGSRRLSKDERWANSIDQQWAIVEQSDKPVPFLVCNTEYGVSAEVSTASIRDQLKVDLLVSCMRKIC